MSTPALERPASLAFRTWRKMRALFNAWLAHMTIYRAELIIWMLVGMLPLIMMTVWIGKAQQAGEVGGFTPSAFAAYFLAAWMSQQFTVAWVAWEMSFQVRQGQFSTKLLRPLDPFWEYFAQHFTERLVRGPFVIAIVIAGVLLIPGTRLTPDFWHFLAYLLLINLAFVMRFLIAYCIAMLSFWFENSTSFDEFYFVIFSFVGGGFAPLELFPAPLRAFLEWTPFPYIAYYPAKALNGTLEPDGILRVALVLVAWIALLTLLSRLMWRSGIKKYGAVGA